MGELTKGAIIPGKGGKRYVYLGGDPKSRDSYREFTGEAPPPKQWGEGLATLAYDAGAKVTDLAMQTSSGEVNALNNAGLKMRPEAAAGLGFATNVLTQAIPSILSGGPVKATTASITKPVGRAVMQSAVKPKAADLASGKAKEAIETMLKEGVNVTQGGMAKLSSEVSRLSGEVDDMVKSADKSGVTVNKVEAAKRVQDALQRFRAQVNPGSDMAKIQKAADDFLNHPDLKALDDIPVALAQKMKSGTYSILGSKPYGELGGAEIEAQKALARGLKEEIEKVVPGVVAKNAKQRELLNAIEVVSPRANIAGNQNLAGLAPLAEEMLGGGAFLLDRSSIFKSILGRSLYSGAPSIMGNAARVGTAGVMSTTANDY